MFIKAFCAVSERRSKQPASLNRLPNISIKYGIQFAEPSFFVRIPSTGNIPCRQPASRTAFTQFVGTFVTHCTVHGIAVSYTHLDVYKRQQLYLWVQAAGVSVPVRADPGRAVLPNRQHGCGDALAPAGVRRSVYSTDHGYRPCHLPAEGCKIRPWSGFAAGR